MLRILKAKSGLPGQPVACFGEAVVGFGDVLPYQLQELGGVGGDRQIALAAVEVGSDGGGVELEDPPVLLERAGQITVYRVPEPDPEAIEGSIAGAIPLEYQYPDGVFNAEALFVADGSIFFVTKDRDEARVYRGDATGDGSEVETLELVIVLDLGAEVSGADMSWDGSTIAFRGYKTVWMWHRPPGTQIADALAAEPCTAPSPDEVQGESIAFLANGSYATVSEGSHPDLHVVERGN